jgi:hypothetical protein
MVHSKIVLRTLLCLVLITGVVAVLPAAAQEADGLVSNERGTVGISSPAADDMISGAVVIMGTAISPEFSYYKVEYSVDGDTWFPIDGEAYKHETAVTNDVLATWDTTVFTDGAYWLRAVVVDDTGNYVASDPIMVMVDNSKVEEEVAVETEEEVAVMEEQAAEEAVAEEAVAEEEVTQEEAASPSGLVSNERGTVGISSPAADDMISGAVVITGTAISPGFSYYKVEYSVDGDTWIPVDGEAYKHETAVTNDVLATWDTTVFTNGAYWLRAVVVDNTGNYVASGPIMVTVDNQNLTEEMLKNAGYQGIYEEPIQLTDGTYEGEPFVEGGASRPTVTFIQPYAVGDLNGDGVDDAAVLLVESSGGSGSFVYMAAVLNQDGKPENVDTVLLGDRVQVQSLTIADDQINVTMLAHGPDDPLCCPTQEVEQTYELQDNKLVQTGGDVISSGE